jgi:hypothetical protein
MDCDVRDGKNQEPLNGIDVLWRLRQDKDEEVDLTSDQKVGGSWPSGCIKNLSKSSHSKNQITSFGNYYPRIYTFRKGIKRMPYLYAVRMLIPGHELQPIKVGFSTNPNNRMRHYDAGPYPCEWLGVWQGTIDEEKSFHARFKEIRLTGEWFLPNIEFLAEIQAKIKDHQEACVSPAFLNYRETLKQRALEVLASHDYRPDAVDAVRTRIVRIKT